VTACKDFDHLLPLHAAGVLEPDEASRVEAHLAECAGCRAEAAADAAVLSLAKLAPPTEAEQRAVADVPRRALAALHRADGRRARWKRSLVGIAAAAAALLAVLSPAVLQREARLPRDAAALMTAAEAEAAWEEPDLDTLWDDSGLLDLDASGTAATSLDETDAALVAVDL
jgi:anti-sigma factor RsiW